MPDIQEQLAQRQRMMESMAAICEGHEIVVCAAALGEVVSALFVQAREKHGNDDLFEDWLRMLISTVREPAERTH